MCHLRSKLDPFTRVRGTGYGVQGTGYGVRGFRVRGTGYGVQAMFLQNVKMKMTPQMKMEMKMETARIKTMEACSMFQAKQRQTEDKLKG